MPFRNIADREIESCKSYRKLDTLNDTVVLMNSPDYTERFIAEYWQTKIRYDKLHAMLVKLEAQKLDFVPKCSFTLLSEQAARMGAYLRCLEVRAEIEEIDLRAPIKKPADTGIPTMHSFPVSEGDTVHYVEKTSDNIVSFVPYKVCGLAVKDGKQYVITEDGDLNEIWSEMCILDIGSAADAIKAKRI